MTRDEAIQRLTPGKPCSLTVEAAKFVDWAHRLGMLKLDEPKRSPETVLCEILSCEGVGGLAQRAVLDSIISAGLKIVSKEEK